MPGPATDALCQAARGRSVNVVMGLHERDTTYSGGTLYNSLAFISDEGQILGVHRKLIPTHAERILWGQGDGSGLIVADMSVGKVGGLICWEHWMPLPRFALHAKGEQVHVAAWPDAPDIEQVASRHYAFEGRCFVVCAASWLTIDDVPDGFQGREALAASINPAAGGGADGVLIPGGSSIIGPDGNFVVEPLYGKEAVVYGEIDLSRIHREHQAMDTVGHYNRPDIFRVTIDDVPRSQVTWLSGQRAQAEAGAETPPVQ